MATQVLELKAKLERGDLIDGKYKVVKKLGEGGCGSVFRCQLVRNPEELLAIKLLESPNDLQRFEREVEVIKGVNSPFVVAYRGTGKYLQFPYLAMEYMAGGSLRDYLEAKKTLPVKEAAWVTIMAIRGLRDCKTVHRDLKPENLLITKAANNRIDFLIDNIKKGSVVKVADFGLAKSFDVKRTRITMTGQIMGTPLYMSPEQCQNTHLVTGKSDIYALGVLLYEMVNGDTPFNANDPYTLLKMHNEDEPKYPRSMDQQIQAVVRRCLQKKPEKRYATLADLEHDLAIIAGVKKPKSAGGGASGGGISEGARWVMIAAGMALFIALSWMLRDRVLAHFNDWWNPEPMKMQRK
jgi:serine/threonine protein kinase